VRPLNLSKFLNKWLKGNDLIKNRAKFIVQKSEEEKKLTIIRAEAESESARIFNESINNFGTGMNFCIYL
jgi:hypothetical protein